MGVPITVIRPWHLEEEPLPVSFLLLRQIPGSHKEGLSQPGDTFLLSAGSRRIGSPKLSYLHRRLKAGWGFMETLSRNRNRNKGKIKDERFFYLVNWFHCYRPMVNQISLASEEHGGELLVSSTCSSRKGLGWIKDMISLSGHSPSDLHPPTCSYLLHPTTFQ